MVYSEYKYSEGARKRFLFESISGSGIKHYTVQNSTRYRIVQNSTEQYTVQNSTEQYRTVQNSTRYRIEQNRTKQYTVQNSTEQYRIIQNSTILYNGSVRHGKVIAYLYFYIRVWLINLLFV